MLGRTRVGAYQLVGEIARGGMAVVHFAVRPGQAQPTVADLFALKQILPQFAGEAIYRQLFAAEVGLVVALDHPNVVRCVDQGAVNGAPFMVMEYVHGRALNRVISGISAQGKRLPVPYGVYIARQLLEGLAHVHEAKDGAGRPLDITLCDLSPSNVMLGYDGSVKLIDFGIASSQLRFFEQIGVMKGKKNYMAPEQLRGQSLDQRADIYAAATCLFELLASETLFGGKGEFEIEEAIRTGNLPIGQDRLPQLPPGLYDCLTRALSVERAERYQTAREFSQALEPYARLGKGGLVAQESLAKTLGVFLSPLRQVDDARLAEVFTEAEETVDPEPLSDDSITPATTPVRPPGPRGEG